MKTPKPSTSSLAAFTLVELLVSITILGIILLSVAQVVGYVAQLWQNGVGAVDNLSKTRSILEVLDRDAKEIVLRPDTAAFVDGGGNPACVFYTSMEGAPGSDLRSVSLVDYVINPLNGSSVTAQTTLARLNYGMNFKTASGSAITPYVLSASTPTSMAQLPASTAQNTETLATGVIRFEWQFVDGAGNLITPTSKTTNFSYDFTAASASSNPRAMIVSVLVLSNPACQLASQNPTILNKLYTDFKTTLPSNTQTYSAFWNSTLDSQTADFDPTLPPTVRSGLKAFSRYIPLPTAAP